MRSHWIQRLIAGAVIGIGAVLPGVSGGVMAVSMGLYEPMLSAVSHFFKDIRGNLRFLAPLLAGGVVGLLLIARALTWLMTNAQTQVIILFIGLVLGGIPALWKQANADINWNKARQWLPRLAAIAIGLALTQLLALLEGVTAGGATLETISVPQAILAGAIYAFGTIIPGISSSFMLIYLGLYQPLLEAVSSLNFLVLACAGAGFVAMCLLLIRGVEACFKRFPRIAYNVVLGFVLGSIALIWSWNTFFARWALNLLLLVMGFGLSLLIARGFGSNTNSSY